MGLGVWAYYGGAAFDRSDEIFPRFILEALPIGLKGLLIAGVFAAAMSTLSSSINSLASATAYDFWAPARNRVDDDRAILRAGRWFTIAWTLLLILAAILFIPLSRQSAAVEVSLGIASLVYGGLLGAFALARFVPRARAPDTMAAMVTGIGSMILLWVFARQLIAWPWYVAIGTGLTLGLGALLAARRPKS